MQPITGRSFDGGRTDYAQATRLRFGTEDARRQGETAQATTGAATRRTGDRNRREPPRYRRARGCPARCRSEEHTSELQSLMRISYAVFCLKKKNTPNTTPNIL